MLVYNKMVLLFYFTVTGKGVASLFYQESLSELNHLFLQEGVFLFHLSHWGMFSARIFLKSIIEANSTKIADHHRISDSFPTLQCSIWANGSKLPL